MIWELSSGGLQQLSWKKNHTPSGVSIINPPHKLSSSILFLHFHFHHFILCSSLVSIRFFHCAYVLFFLHFNSVMHCFIAFFHIFQFQQCIIHVTLYWFLSLPLEVNLHTYLTTWLNSCPVGIFPRFHHFIVKISILSKVSHLKWNHLNSTHHVVFWAFFF